MKKVFLSLFILYLPSLFNFFSADDWFHLRVSQIKNLGEFFNFLSFIRTPQSIAFYRPLPTQVFFFFFQKVFGPNPLPYHVFVLLCFTFSLFLLFHLAKKLLKSDSKALLVTIVYGFSVSNFTRLYFLSAFQEIALVIFSLLTILSYLENKKAKTLFFFVLALLCKETAVVLPVILLIIDWSQKKVKINKLLSYTAILFPYLYLRLFKFGGAVGETYLWNFSPVKAVNTLMWYVLWSIGAPELLVDYIGPGLRPIARFFTDYPIWWFAILGLLLSNIIFLCCIFVKKLRKIDRKFISFVTIFVVSLGPVLFLPQHKFTLELGLPLVWFSLAVTWLLSENGKIPVIFILFYLTLNLSINYLTYTRHYSVGAAKVSKNVYTYFSKNYPTPPPNSYFEFVNDTNNYGPDWGSSTQVSNSISGSELFRVLYHDPSYQVYFEDFKGTRPTIQRIPISTRMFLQ